VTEFQFTPASDGKPPVSASDAPTVEPTADSDSVTVDQAAVKPAQVQPKRTDKYRPYVW